MSIYRNLPYTVNMLWHYVVSGLCKGMAKFGLPDKSNKSSTSLLRFYAILYYVQLLIQIDKKTSAKVSLREHVMSVHHLYALLFYSFIHYNIDSHCSIICHCFAALQKIILQYIAKCRCSFLFGCWLLYFCFFCTDIKSIIYML